MERLKKLMTLRSHNSESLILFGYNKKPFKLIKLKYSSVYRFTESGYIKNINEYAVAHGTETTIARICQFLNCYQTRLKTIWFEKNIKSVFVLFFSVSKY